jgi:hypothetical protein
MCQTSTTVKLAGLPVVNGTVNSLPLLVPLKEYRITTVFALASDRVDGDVATWECAADLVVAGAEQEFREEFNIHLAACWWLSFGRGKLNPTRVRHSGRREHPLAVRRRKWRMS